MQGSGNSQNKRFLTASADGVGTKAILAASYNMYQGMGQDLVAMCVNDLICQGGKPLFFLDYMGFNNVEEKIFHVLIKSIRRACKEAGCELIGGETAEMPGLYNKNYFDIAGFAVGMVTEKELLPRDGIESGDLIIGLPSSGVHSNGFSLIRMILKERNIDPVKETIEDKRLIDALMTPTTIYVKPLRQIMSSIHACAHITGGGMKNIQRVLPDSCTYHLHHIDFPPVFKWIQDAGEVSREEMLEVFNCGYGMVLITSPDKEEEVSRGLEKTGMGMSVIGKVIERPPSNSQGE